jgi:O-antigen/teichoic acid export membrane protein
VSGAADSLKRKVPAGLVDAGLNSLATFGVGIAAAQLFDASILGVYAVFFTAYQLGLVIPMFLIYLPAEVKAVARDVTSRLPIMRWSLPVGFTASLLSLASVGLAALVVWSHTDRITVLYLAATAIVPTALMPAQAHTRRMLHIAGHSWRAASVSAVQLLATVVGLGLLLMLDVPDTLVPFGAFGMSAAASLVAGLVLAKTVGQKGGDPVRWRELTSAGRWLLVTGMAPNLGGFAIAALIGSLAGTEALGYAEGARLAAQPLMVLGVGLNASLGPRSMEAGYEGDRPKAKHVARLFILIIGATTIGYLVAAGIAWTWNPLTWLVPQAYEIPGLTALTIVASALASTVLPNQRELYGGGYEKRLAFIDVVANSFGVIFATTAAVTGAFARPLSLGASNSWRALHYQRALATMYAERSPSAGRAVDESSPIGHENTSS